MRADPLPSVAADLLRQSLEHLDAPTLVADGRSTTPVISLSNAAARNAGFAEGTSVLEALDARLAPPPDEAAAVDRSLRAGRSALLRWSAADGSQVTLRVTPLETERPDAPPLTVLTWSRRRERDGRGDDGAAPRDDLTIARRDLHDWLARTPVTRNSLRDVVRGLTERICELYDLERASVWLFSDDDTELRCLDRFERTPRRHATGDVLLANDCASEFGTLRRSLFVDVHDTSTDPRAAGYREAYLEPNGITSMLDAVIRFGGRCYGTLCLEHVRRPHVWREHEIDFACAIASHVATALESLARREAEARAREQERALEALVEGSPLGIQLFGIDGRSRRVNAAMRRIFGDAPLHDDLLDGERAQRGGLDAVFRRALDGEVVELPRHEVELPGAEPRTAWLECLFFPVFDDARDVRHVVLFAREVTDRVQAEQERQGLEQKLRQTQKIEAVGKLAGGVAHDFNNVLTAVRGFADLLRMDLGDQSPQRDLVEQVRRAAERGSALTAQLLAFGRRDLVTIEVFDAGNAVVEMLPMLRRLLEEGVRIDVHADGATPISADRTQLQQVLLNLLLNARDAVRDGGNVELRVAARERHVELLVRDDGVGMDAETARRAFEPFFTTRSDERTGLGLPTVHSIVTGAGGTIDLDSAPGRGTTVRIRLPLAEVTARPDDEAAPRDLEARQGETVLVVEDDDANRRLACEALRRFGYRVHEAADGEDALALATEHGDIGLVLTDVVMPGIGGRLLAAELRRMQPDLRIVYASGYTNDDVLRHGVQTDEVAFLAKPYSVDRLAAVVRATFDS